MLTVCGFSILSCVVFLQAQSNSEEDILFLDIPAVITATLTEKNVNDAPAAVTVITRREIQESGAKNLADLLRRVNGISSHKIDRTIISMRGIQDHFNAKFKLMVNGHAFFDPMWNTFEYYDLALENIKQIEIVRGPGSALYGTSAFAGVINIITRDPKDISGYETDVRCGSFNTTQANIAYGRNAGDYRFGCYVNYFDYPGASPLIEKDMLAGSPVAVPPAHGSDELRKAEANINFAYKQFSVNGTLFQSDSRMFLPELGALTDAGEKFGFTTGFLEAKYDLALSDRLQIKSKVSCDNINTIVKGKLMPDGFSFGADINGDGVQETWPDGWNGEYGYRSDIYRAESIADWKTSDSNEILLGAFYENIRDKDVFIKADFNILYLYRYTQMTDLTDICNWNKPAQRIISGFFFQDEWKVAKDWYVIVGGRSDDYSDVGVSLTPRCGIIWNYDKNANIKLLYGSAFRAPSFAELYHQNNPSMIGNPNLKPETLESAELDFNHIQGKLITNAAVYGSMARNMIDISTDRDTTKPFSPVYTVNSNRIRIWGAELYEKYVFQLGDYVYAGYTYTNAKDDVTDISSPFVPENQVSIGYNVRFFNTFNWHVDADYTSEQDRLTGSILPRLDSTIVVDTTLRYEATSDAALYLSVYNLTNQALYYPANPKFAPATDIKLAGTNYMIGVTYHF